MLKVTAAAIAKEFTRRNIPFEILDEGRGMLKYFNMGEWRYTCSSLDDRTSPVGVRIADSKDICTRLVRSTNVKVPDEIIFRDDKNLEDFLNKHRTVVVKPNDAAHGNGVTINIHSIDALLSAASIAKASSLSGNVIIQQQVKGSDVRVLVIDGKVAAASERVSASIVGDGVSTIAQLIDTENKNPKRGADYSKELNFIDVSVAEIFLKEHINFVPTKDTAVSVIGAVNIGQGGKSIDRTESIPSEIADKACEIADLLHLNVCGVDFMTNDIGDESQYYFIEANASPSFGLHLSPSEGIPRAVDELFVDYLTK